MASKFVSTVSCDLVGGYLEIPDAVAHAFATVVSELGVTLNNSSYRFAVGISVIITTDSGHACIRVCRGRTAAWCQFVTDGDPSRCNRFLELMREAFHAQTKNIVYHEKGGEIEILPPDGKAIAGSE